MIAHTSFFLYLAKGEEVNKEPFSFLKDIFLTFLGVGR